jgi:transposase InsO family protein
MRVNDIQVRSRRRFKATTDSKHGLPVAANILSQDFNVDRPNHVWATDITYIWTLEGWLYLAVVEDLFSRRVVGWSMADHMKTESRHGCAGDGRSVTVSPKVSCYTTPTEAVSMRASRTRRPWSHVESSAA